MVVSHWLCTTFAIFVKVRTRSAVRSVANLEEMAAIAAWLVSPLHSNNRKRNDVVALMLSHSGLLPSFVGLTWFARSHSFDIQCTIHAPAKRRIAATPAPRKTSSKNDFRNLDISRPLVPGKCVRL